jgi:hypothetical protein
MSTCHIPYPTDFTIGHAAAHRVNPHVACAEEGPRAR